MTLPSAEQTFSTALSRNADSWLSIPGFLGASNVSSNDPDDLMQDVPNLAFFNDPIESGTWFTPNFVHGLHATQLERGQDSCQAITPVQPPLNHMSSLNNKSKSKSNACTPARNTHLSVATNRVKGSARIGKTKKHSAAIKGEGTESASVSSICSTREGKEGSEILFQVVQTLQTKVRLEKLIDEAICSDDASDSSSISEASDLEVDSAYGSFSDIPLSDVSSSVFEEQYVYLGRQATALSSIQDSELHSDEETPRPLQPLSPTYSCTYGPGDERCPYATGRKSDWIRHEESEKHWPQKRYMCMLCAELQSDDDSNPCCTYCSLAFSTIEAVRSHSLNCIEARRKGKTFTGAKTDHFQAHLVDVPHRPGLDTTSAAWTYNHKTKWPRYCGFCTYHFKDWEERKHHVAEHFRRGADISNWDPLLHNPRRKTADEPGLPPINDEDDDDDDDHSHQHGRGKYSTYEATQTTYSTRSGDSSGHFDLLNNGYLDWDNNEGGWGQYNIEYEERCSNSLESCLNRLGKNRLGMKQYIPAYDSYDPYVSKFISNSYFTGNNALNSEPINTVSTAFHNLEMYETSKWIIISAHYSQLSLNNDSGTTHIFAPVDRSYCKISLANMGIEREPSQVTLNSQRRPREYCHSSTDTGCSIDRVPSKWLRQWRNVHGKRDKKLCFESRRKNCIECEESCIREDSLRNHWVLDRMHHFRDNLKSHHRRVADSVNCLLSGVIFKNQSKLCTHAPAEGCKICRVFKTSYSGPLHQRPEEYEDESLLTSSDTISWGDKGNYIFDPSNCSLNNKKTCGPGKRLQEYFSEYKRDRMYRVVGQSCRGKPDWPQYQGFKEQLWECARSSGITEEQLIWLIVSDFMPFGITSDRLRYQKAKPGFLQSVALERYLSDYNCCEHLAYLASRHIGGDERSPSSALMHSPCFTSDDATLSLQYQQEVWFCLFRLPEELFMEHTVDGRRAIVDGQDVDTHLLLGGVRAFEPGRTTFLHSIEMLVLEEGDGDGEHLE
ncbi:uncharacterized protein EAE98_006201 [Botrytis deweyae]|uniref:C2H2-type domain-containing protein n=1 Tax=Botrytis deweyae TaxID=2478750 RepID=A0ABQ7IKF5_9HELO|nr:uncharacterized protein EAE98_006201 [Botrytis deweyae]KAF7926816.1 hypothetical protein EAE98_006201 [Botrytis deweyae]